MFKTTLTKLISGETMPERVAEEMMDTVMTGEATDSQIGSFLTALSIRGETVDELTGFAKSMRKHALIVPHDIDGVMDTCGTGGDGQSTFNISTAVSILLASLNLPVAKHGNRAVSSKSGSADVLEALGVPIQQTKEEAAEALKRHHLSFLYAPLYHQAMKHAASPRKELGFRTLFNLLGPLVNPARTPYQLLGVFDTKHAESMAHVLHRLGSERALIVTGHDGLDECTITGKTDVVELKDGDVSRYTLHPEDVGLKVGSHDELVVHSVDESAQLITAIFEGTANESATNIVLLNAGCGLYVRGHADTIAEGVHEARKAITSQLALRKLSELKGVTTNVN